MPMNFLLQPQGLLAPHGQNFEKGLYEEFVPPMSQTSRDNLKEWQEKADRIYQNKQSSDFQNNMRGEPDDSFTQSNSSKEITKENPRGGFGRNIRAWDQDDPDYEIRSGLLEIGGTGFLPRKLPKGRQTAHVSNAESRDTSARMSEGAPTTWHQVLGSMSEDSRQGLSPDHPMVQVSRAFMRMTPKTRVILNFCLNP